MPPVSAAVKSIEDFIHQLHDLHRNYRHMEWYKLDTCLQEFEEESADPFVMGRRNNSEIWKGYRLDGAEFVFKIIRPDDFHILYNEVFYILKLGETDYATHLYDYYIRPTDGFAVLVFTLYDDYKPSKANLLGEVRQLLDAVRQLHATNIVHRDIKPTNLLRDKFTNKLVIGDFAFATGVGDDECSKHVGTPGYFIKYKQEEKAERTDQFAYDMVSNCLLYYLLTILSTLLDARSNGCSRRPTNPSMAKCVS